MTSMGRVLKTLGHQEPDRVPMFLLLTMHGAKELGMGIREYFSKAENLVEGQMRLAQKFQNDCIYTFFYAPVEVEAFGGEVIWAEDGPPNAGEPLIRDIEDIMHLHCPEARSSKALQKVYKATELLKQEVGNEIPIIGVVMSPFSLPVMQIGFDRYLEIMHFRPDLFKRLMEVNQAFSVAYANAQLEAGATAICYFDPVSSPTIIPRDLYLRTGFEIACSTIGMIKGPTATHFASGSALEIADDVAKTGTAVIGISTHEDITALKSACRGKLTLLGNLNGIAMRNWTGSECRAIIADILEKAAPGGGFILSDNHGEIPFQVSEEILMTISETVQTLGHYPIRTAQ